MANPDRTRDTDRRIVAALRADARQSNVALAKQVGLTEGAVRRRIDNLVATGALRFVAVPDPQWLGTTTQALLRIRCAPHLIDEVLHELRTVPELERIYHCTGSFDITAVGHFESTATLREFTVSRVGTIPGIVELQSELILQTIDGALTDAHDGDRQDAPEPDTLDPGAQVTVDAGRNADDGLVSRR